MTTIRHVLDNTLAMRVRVQEWQERPLASGKGSIAFLVLTDQTGEMKGLVWPPQWLVLKPILTGGGALEVVGEVKTDEKGPVLRIHEARSI